ncbi:MAG: glycosyltransferase family 1 protein [Eubacteriaceae bacterium]
MEPIRILQVFGQMNRGGAETMIMNLYRNIDRSKVQFDFIVHTEEKCAYDDEIIALGGKIFRVPRYRGRNHFQYKKVWKKFFKEHLEYKIIHGHIRSTASIYLKIAKEYGLITIIHSHSTSNGGGFTAKIKNQLQKKIEADYYFACSKKAGEWLFGSERTKKENFQVICNAIDLEKFAFNEELRNINRKKLGLEEKFVIGHVGRFDPPKNHAFLIDVFSEIYKENGNARLLLVGDGALREKIKTKVNKLGLAESVIFTGVSPDVNELMMVMDAFVFPSLYEGLPVTIIEAQAAGLYCVISDQISKEVKITNLVKFLSIKNSEKEWSMEVMKIKTRRVDKRNEIKKEGYDINFLANLLTEIYLIAEKN